MNPKLTILGIDFIFDPIGLVILAIIFLLILFLIFR